MPSSALLASAVRKATLTSTSSRGKLNDPGTDNFVRHVGRLRKEAELRRQALQEKEQSQVKLKTAAKDTLASVDIPPVSVLGGMPRAELARMCTDAGHDDVDNLDRVDCIIFLLTEKDALKAQEDRQGTSVKQIPKKKRGWFGSIGGGGGSAARTTTTEDDGAAGSQSISRSSTECFLDSGSAAPQPLRGLRRVNSTGARAGNPLQLQLQRPAGAARRGKGTPQSPTLAAVHGRRPAATGVSPTGDDARQTGSQSPSPARSRPEPGGAAPAAQQRGASAAGDILRMAGAPPARVAGVAAAPSPPQQPARPWAQLRGGQEEARVEGSPCAEDRGQTPPLHIKRQTHDNTERNAMRMQSCDPITEQDLENAAPAGGNHAGKLQGTLQVGTDFLEQFDGDKSLDVAMRQLNACFGSDIDREERTGDGSAMAASLEMLNKLTPNDMAALEVAFQSSDANESDSLDFIELQELWKLMFPKLSEDEVDRITGFIFEDIDTDCDHEIHWHEFRSYLCGEYEDPEEEELAGIVGLVSFVKHDKPDTWRHWLWALMEQPAAEKYRVGWLLNASFALASIVQLFIVLATANLIMESRLDLSQSMKAMVHGLEWACSAVFSAELSLRIVACPLRSSDSKLLPSQFQFWTMWFTWVDVLSVVPFYLGETGVLSGGNNFVFVRVVRLVRLVRTMRMFKLGKHSAGIQLLMISFSRARLAIGWMCMLLIMAVVLFGSMMFYAELQDVIVIDSKYVRANNTLYLDSGRPIKLQSITEAMWWAIGALTTSAYGDIIPNTDPGKAVSSVVVVIGLLLCAYPITIITVTFANVWDQYTHMTERSNRRKLLFEAAAGDQTGATDLIQSNIKASVTEHADRVNSLSLKKSEDAEEQEEEHAVGSGDHPAGKPGSCMVDEENGMQPVHNP